MPLFNPPADILYQNVKNPKFGAIGNGSADDTTALQKAINAGIAFLPDGPNGTVATYGISVPLTMTTNGSGLLGVGSNAQIVPLPGFTGSALIQISADFCWAEKVQLYGGSSTVANNPTADGIQFNGAQHCFARDIEAYDLNGQVIKAVATSSKSNASLVLDNIHGFNNVAGIYIQGHANQNFLCQHKCTNLDMERVVSGNAYDFIDCTDIKVDGLFGASNGSSGVSVNIQGAVSSLLVTNADVGVTPNVGTQSVIRVQDGTNGSPKRVYFVNVTCQQGLDGAFIDGGASDLKFTQACFRSNQRHGVNIGGTVSAFLLKACSFSTNGVNNNNVTSYELQSSTTGEGELESCEFLTSIGAGANQVTNPLNITAGTVDVNSCRHMGTNHTPSNFFATGGTAKTTTNTKNYNREFGFIGSPPSVPTSGSASSTRSTDCMVYINANGANIASISVGGTNTGLPGNQPFYVLFLRANVAITMSYTVAIPTWTWEVR